MENNALRINPQDNVAIAIRGIKQGEDVVVDGVIMLQAAGDIPPSHKVALVDIKVDGNIVRYGEPIVQAREEIKKGSWVHVHNTRTIERPPEQG